MIQQGSRVLVFDSLLYVNDKKTPLSVTLKPATVVSKYVYVSKIDQRCFDVIDIEFDHRPGISKAHFTDSAREIS